MLSTGPTWATSEWRGLLVTRVGHVRDRTDGEIKYHRWREISECRAICPGRGWDSRKDLRQNQMSHQREKVIFERGWCLLIFQKWKWAYVFIEKFHKHNETSGEMNTSVSEVFRQRRTTVKSSLFFPFVRGYLECLFPTGGGDELLSLRLHATKS